MSNKTHRYALWAIPFVVVCVVLVLMMTDRNAGMVDRGQSALRPGPRYTIESPVYLYFQDTRQGFLGVEERLVAHPETAVEFARTIVGWLIKGPLKDLGRTLPEETVLRALYVDDGTAYVDFSQDIHDGHPGGARTEYLTIVSITNSLILNVPEIKRVHILIDGREAETLAGHIDIRKPFSADMLVVR